MSKWQIFVGSVETQDPIVIVLVVFAALNSVLSLGYYAPIVNRMYRKTPSQAVLSGKPVSVFMTVPIIIMIIGVVVLGVWPGLIENITLAAGQSLTGLFDNPVAHMLPLVGR